MAGWFGPSDYDECVLEKMKGQSKSVLPHARKYCKSKFQNTSDKKISVDEFLDRLYKYERGEFMPDLTSKFNKSLPIMVDKGTRLDNVIVYKKEMIYSYSMTNKYAYKLKSTEFIRLMRNKIKEGICTNPRVAPILKNGSRIVYAYKGKEGAHIGQFAIYPSECGFK